MNRFNTASFNTDTTKMNYSTIKHHHKLTQCMYLFTLSLALLENVNNCLRSVKKIDILLRV
jgi:hypothetical protein